MYEVYWLDPAMLRLRHLYDQANDPDAITAAMSELDRRLGADPEGESESRDGTERVAFADPLGVSFEITGNQVDIEAVWLTRRT
jgi:hypothetical protein